jgi:hypothetical protein
MLQGSKSEKMAIPLSGPILQRKTLEFASQLDIADFKASNGWLEKFNVRHAIKACTVSDESAGVDLQTVDDFVVVFQKLFCLFFILLLD